MAIQNASSGDSDQTVWIHRLIWVFTGRTSPKVRSLTLWLNLISPHIISHLAFEGMFMNFKIIGLYSKTCVRQPPLKLTLVVDVKRWLSYKGTCHVILLAKLHDMYLYKTDNFFHINRYLKSVLKVAVLHRFYCTIRIYSKTCVRQPPLKLP